MCQHHRFHAAPFASPKAVAHHAPDLRLEPIDLLIDLRFDIPNRWAAGYVEQTVLCHGGGARTLRLDAVDLRIGAVEDLDGSALSWAYDGEALDITWALAPSAGERRRIRISYEVHEPVTGLLFSSPCDDHPDKPYLVASDHETERARHWLPCVDHPAVRTSLRFRLRAEADLTILANGAPQGEEHHDDGTKTATWRLEERCPSYILCVSIGRFRRIDLGEHEAFGKRVPVAAFAASRHDEATLQRTFGGTRAMLDWMTRKLGTPFPFPSYHQFAVPAIGGAMENITLVSWDDQALLDEHLERERRLRMDAVNVHEMAHQWFGDALVVRDFAHVWLKESWASYMESVWVEDQLGEDERAFYLWEERRDYVAEADDRYVRPIVTRAFDSSWDMYDQHLYPGGAARIHMLRRLLGDDLFWEGVRLYVRRHAGTCVETDDFRRALEEVSGRSLSRFFDRWFHSPGYPKLEGSATWDGEHRQLVVAVEQKQIDDKKGIGAFDFDLPVAVELEDGTWERKVLAVRENKASLHWVLPSRPRTVVPDPDGDLMVVYPWTLAEDWLRRALVAAPVSGRLWAARTMGRLGKPSLVSALLEALVAEPFRGVRIEVARALGDCGQAKAVKALADRLGAETDATVQAAIALALVGVRDENVRSAALSWVREAGRPYLVSGTVWKILARQRNAADLPLFLGAVVEEEGFWGHRRRGVVGGLGEWTDPQARTALIDVIRDRRQLRQVRLAALDAAGVMGRRLIAVERAPLAEAAIDTLRDPDYGTRQAAARALLSMGHKEAASTIEAMTRTLAAQDRPRLLKGVTGLRTAGEERADDKNQRRLEGIEERVRRLEGAKA